MVRRRQLNATSIEAQIERSARCRRSRGGSSRRRRTPRARSRGRPRAGPGRARRGAPSPGFPGFSSSGPDGAAPGEGARGPRAGPAGRGSNSTSRLTGIGNRLRGRVTAPARPRIRPARPRRARPRGRGRLHGRVRIRAVPPRSAPRPPPPSLSESHDIARARLSRRRFRSLRVRRTPGPRCVRAEVTVTRAAFSRISSSRPQSSADARSHEMLPVTRFSFFFRLQRIGRIAIRSRFFPHRLVTLRHGGRNEF